MNQHRTCRTIRWHFLGVLCGWACLCTPHGRLLAQAQALSVTFGDAGLERISYDGAVLEEMHGNGAGGFHIGHMKLTDMQGAVLHSNGYDWGENHRSRLWDRARKQWLYRFVWGQITVGYVQVGNRLDMHVNENNDSQSGVILDGASIYPLLFGNGNSCRMAPGKDQPEISLTSDEPGLSAAECGAAELVVAAEDQRAPLYVGFIPTSEHSLIMPILSTTAPDELPSFAARRDRPVRPGKSDSFTVSLRFARSGTPATTMGADAYTRWGRAWPATLHWTDRRPIGTIFLASSPPAGGPLPHESAQNPRRYFENSKARTDVNTAGGMLAFQREVLARAAENVVNLRRLGAQGAIVWDIEGEQYPQSTSYVGAPDLIASVAPEMERVVSDRSSSYFGMKLDDAYFKTLTSGGFRVGVCVRPQRFTVRADGTAEQVFLDEAGVLAELLKKMQFAHDRWGVTIFYIDSSVDRAGAPLQPGLLQELARRLPDSLLIPEESVPRAYAYAAPFQTFLHHDDLGTSAVIHAAYPNGFSVNLINDADPAKLAAVVSQLTEAVTKGDVLMGLVDFWHPNDDTIVSIYRKAHRH